MVDNKEENFNSDYDWFKVSLIQGQTYQFDCIDYNLIDPYLYLRDTQGNTITYDTVFIKGWGVGTLIPNFANIVYEDVGQRESDWTFDD